MYVHIYVYIHIYSIYIYGLMPVEYDAINVRCPHVNAVKTGKMITLNNA